MLGQTITLNDLIQTANKKVGAEAEVLSKLADQDGLEGQLEEILDYVESNEALFADNNLTDVKTALAKFMRKMPPQKLKLTLAAMKREMEEFKAQTQQPEKESGGSILNQSDLDALLAEAQLSHTPPKKSKLVSAAPKEPPQAEKKGNGANGSSMLDQSDIDMLFSKDAAPESDQGQSMDQSFIDSLFSKEQEAVEETAGEPDPEPVDSMEAMQGDTAEAEQADDVDHVTETGNAETVDQDFVDSLLAQGNGAKTVEEAAEESDAAPEAEVEAATAQPEESAAAPQTDDQPLPEEEAESSPEIELAEETAPQAADSREETASADITPDETPRNDDTPSAPQIETAADRAPEAAPVFAVPAPKESPAPGVGVPVAASMSRVLEERGSATVIKEFYRVYVRENGSFRIIFESEQKQQAQMELLKTVQDFPARQVSLGKVTHKEVMVIKEDTNDIPFSLKIDFSE